MCYLRQLNSDPHAVFMDALNAQIVLVGFHLARLVSIRIRRGSLSTDWLPYGSVWARNGSVCAPYGSGLVPYVCIRQHSIWIRLVSIWLHSVSIWIRLASIRDPIWFDMHTFRSHMDPSGFRMDQLGFNVNVCRPYDSAWLPYGLGTLLMWFCMHFGLICIICEHTRHLA